MERKGFGFVETILAIVIIGFVAALTIKTINQNVFMAEQKSMFKKSVSTLSNVIVKVKADLGYNPDFYYDLDTGARKDNDVSLFTTTIGNNLSVAKYCANNALANGCITPIKGLDTVNQANNPNLSDADAQTQTAGNPGLREQRLRVNASAYVLHDGTIIMIYDGNVPILIIDTNGQKPPNKWGYDIFTLWIRGNQNYSKIGCYADIIESGGTKCSELIK